MIPLKKLRDALTIPKPDWDTLAAIKESHTEVLNSLIYPKTLLR